MYEENGCKENTDSIAAGTGWKLFNCGSGECFHYSRKLYFRRINGPGFGSEPFSEHSISACGDFNQLDLLYSWTALPGYQICRTYTHLSYCLSNLFNLTAGLGQAFDGNEPMLYAILAGVLMGCGLGMILQADASSGGLDIPPIILEKKFGLPVSATMWAMDVVLLVLQISQASILSISYGVIYMALTYVTMNQILSSGKHAVEMLVYTPKSEEVLECILHDQDKGASLIHVKSGYLKQEGYAVHSIFRKKDLASMQKAVFDIDPDAFVVISNVRQVRGTGFYPAKYSDLKKPIRKKKRQNRLPEICIFRDLKNSHTPVHFV